jgi:hypothetical protein
MKCTRQRCQLALRILLTAALMPSWASEITNLTPAAQNATKYCNTISARAEEPRTYRHVAR